MLKVEIGARYLAFGLVQKFKIGFVHCLHLALGVLHVCFEHFKTKGAALRQSLFMDGIQQLAKLFVVSRRDSAAARGLLQKEIGVCLKRFFRGAGMPGEAQNRF